MHITVQASGFAVERDAYGEMCVRVCDINKK